MSTKEVVGISQRAFAIGLIAVLLASVLLSYGISSIIIKEGPQGIPGPQGEKGDTGATGATGPQGEPGVVLPSFFCHFKTEWDGEPFEQWVDAEGTHMRDIHGIGYILDSTFGTGTCEVWVDWDVDPITNLGNGTSYEIRTFDDYPNSTLVVSSGPNVGNTAMGNGGGPFVGYGTGDLEGVTVEGWGYSEWTPELSMKIWHWGTITGWAPPE